MRMVRFKLKLIRKKAKRPLIASLEDDKIPEFVAKHLFERRPFYEQSEKSISIDNLTKKEVAKVSKTDEVLFVEVL